MRVILEIHSGPQQGKRKEVKPGQVLTVGRLGQVDVLLPEDPLLSNAHFALECDEAGCRLRDLGSRFGTLVNQAPMTAAVLCDGDRITAGRTTFIVRLKAIAPAGAPPSPPAATLVPPVEASRPVSVSANGKESGAAQDLLTLLRGTAQPLYALLDAARDPRVLDLLTYSREEYQNLYEGPEAEELADWSPYLVKLPPQSPLLVKLVRHGWGNSWGVYLTCDKPFQEVRKHFRHFLMVELEGKGTIYFRFYDPRVLRFFLPTCTPEQNRQLFGPVTAYLMEARKPQRLLKFTADFRGTLRQTAHGVLLPQPVMATRAAAREE